MSQDVSILLIDVNRRRGEELAKKAEEAGYAAMTTNIIPDDDDAILKNDFSIIMIHSNILRGTGADRFRHIMKKQPEAVAIYMVDEERRIGSRNDIYDGIYDYLLLPASYSQLEHVLYIATDRRARFLLEKYYQKYLEEQVSEQLKSLADQQMKLLHADRLSSIGQITAGIIHELNNPLMYIKLNLETLEELQKENNRILIEYSRENEGYSFKGMNAGQFAGETSELVSSIMKGVRHVEKILGNMRTFSRKPENFIDMEFDIHQAISNALNFAKGSLRKNIEVVTELAGDIPPLTGDPQKLEQVFLNLFINASHALEGNKSGKIAIKTARETINGAAYVSILVEDNGAGIPKDVIARVFDPFFTTKPKEKGTGLGLSICKEIVEEMHGTITVKSEEGNGTSFKLMLPLKQTMQGKAE